MFYTKIKTDDSLRTLLFAEQLARRIGAPIERLTHASERNIRSVKCVCTQRVLKFRG